MKRPASFFADDCMPPGSGSTKTADTAELLHAGEAALEAREWETARARFEEAAARAGSAQAWDGLGLACWWLQDATRMFDAKQRAYTAYSAAGERRHAARLAASLANDFLDFRGDVAVAQGWLRRADRLLDGLEGVDADRAWLRLWEARLVSVAQADLEAGMPLIEQAIELAERAGTPDVEVLALALRGLGRVSTGDIREGMAELDEATAAALSGEIADPYTIGLACCYLIAACERTRDWDRAGQWCHQLRNFCTERRLAVILTNCRLQYAGVLMARGEWDACEAELAVALRDAEIARPSIRAAVLARLGELRRRQGRIEEATESYRQAGNHGLALMGGASLDLERGDVAAAAERVERYMRRLRPEAELERAMGLEMLARVEAASGRVEEARATLHRLEEAATSLDSMPLRAAALVGRAAVAAAEGDARSAVAALDDAADLYGDLQLPFEDAWCHLVIARTLLVAGEHARAAREAERAAAGLRELGSAYAEQAAALACEADAAPGGCGEDEASDSAAASGPLSRRELDVLRLVAEGLADRAIAEKLFLSEHTVHRHLSNIRLKLDVSSRSAAVARALRDGLL